MDTKEPGIVYFGTDEFAVMVLEELIKRSLVISLVITTPARPAGRGLAERSSKVASFCATHALQCHALDDLKSEKTRSLLAGYAAAIFCVVSYGKILPADLLSISHYPVINLHPSLLPRWRGASPIQSTLLAGDQMTGVAVIKVTEKVDAGDILAQKSVPISLDMNAELLEQELATEGAGVLAETIKNIQTAGYQAQEQDPARVTYARKFIKSDGQIDWSEPALAIHNKIRAFIKWPTAYSRIKGQNIRIFKSRIVLQHAAVAKPGEIMAIDKEYGIRVMTGEGAVEITEVQLEGKKRMNAFQFAIGARIKPGDRFGDTQ